MKAKLIKNATIYTGSTVIEKGYILHDEQILDVGSMEVLPEGDFDIIDAEGKNIIPGMIDIHIHGGYDVDAMDGNEMTLVKLSEQLIKEGVTSFFPTTMTQDYKEIENAIEASVKAKKLGATVEGIHVEGPFVSKERAGAQPLEYIVEPNVSVMKEWHRKSEGLVKLVTFAPEEQEGREMEQFFKENGIVGSAGHCDALYEDLVDRDVRHYTHLYNQMRGLHHREPGVVGRALLDPDAYVELIPDGIHIHPAMVKLAYKVKGADRICIITDAMRAKGLEDGEYELGGQRVHVSEKRATLDDGTLAGSVLTMDAAFRNIIDFTGCSVEEAVKMTSVNQAEEFGLVQKGKIEFGKDADFVLMDKQYNVQQTVSMGKYY